MKSTDNPAGEHIRSPLGHRIVSWPRRPRRLKGAASSAGGPESSERPTAEISSVQALMELTLPRFAVTEGPRQIHPPWSATDPPASPAPSQIEPRRGKDPRCLIDQTSFSSVYLNLDALISSSSEESLDVKKCEDLAVTVVCKSEGIVTRVNSKEVLSDEHLPSVFGARDIRQVVRRRDKPPDGPTRRTARLDCRQEPSAPTVDLVTGKCNPGKVSRTVSTSPLTLDMTVVCIPEPEILQTRADPQGTLPLDTVNKTVAGFDTSMLAVATPATVVGQPDPQAKDFPTLCQSPPTCFRSSDYRPRPPRLPHPHCRGAQQKTRRLRFHPTGCGRGPFRTFLARAVCSMCHHLHRDSSCGLLGRAEQPRLKGFCYQRCWGTSMIWFWEIRSLMRELNSFWAQNPHCHCLCMHGRRIRPC